MKNKVLWILLGGILLLGAAFVLLNFRAAVSHTQAEKQVIKTGIGEGLPYAMQRRDKISIAVDGEGPLVEAVRKALAAEMNKAGIGGIELAQGLGTVYPNPVLIIKVGEKPGMVWTPFFATSRFSIQAGFASNGDTSFMGKTPVTVDNKNGPALNMSAEFKVSDRSWGLISRPGYYQLLADYLAQQIAVAVKELYQV